MRSFSNLWYWIMLAVVWSAASHRVLGVPFDLIQRAGRHGGQFEADMHDLVRIYTARIMMIARTSGMWLLGLACFLLTMLALLGFVYAIEFAQALFLIAMPMSIVGALSIRAAQVIRARGLHGAALRKRLIAHRRITQVIGMLSILVTSFWGMYQNLSLGVLGG